MTIKNFFPKNWLKSSFENFERWSYFMDIIPASLVGFLQWISFLTFLAKIQLLDAWIYQQYEELDLWMSFNVSGVRNRNNYKTTNLCGESHRCKWLLKTFFLTTDWNLLLKILKGDPTLWILYQPLWLGSFSESVFSHSWLKSSYWMHEFINNMKN